MPERGGLNFHLNAELMATVRWSEGSCGQVGCSDSECVCALCAKPIGIPEDDPRRANHDPDCFGCEICRDDVPVMLFRRPGPGARSTQAEFHTKCFERLLQPERL